MVVLPTSVEDENREGIDDDEEEEARVRLLAGHDAMASIHSARVSVVMLLLLQIWFTVAVHRRRDLVVHALVIAIMLVILLCRVYEPSTTDVRAQARSTTLVKRLLLSVEWPRRHDLLLCTRRFRRWQHAIPMPQPSSDSSC